MIPARAPAPLLTAAELARQGLPGFPTTKRGVNKLLKRSGARGSKRAGREGGGGLQYDLVELLAVLPARAAAALRRRHAPDMPPVRRREPQAAGALKEWQRRVADDRAILCQEIERLVADGWSASAAITAICGEFPNLNAASCWRWYRAWRSGGWAALAPASRERAGAPPVWLPELMSLYARPGKPSIAACYERLSAERDDLPTLRTVQRAVRGLSAITRRRGRMGPREIKAVLPYVARDVSGLEPGDVYTADGHTADLECASPETGRPFRPEIVSVLDVRTRLCVGWSAGLAEGAWLVADALRNAATACIPGILYVDRGPGFVNDHLGHEAAGVLARIGTTLSKALPYSSQARGAIERFHASCWVRGARFLPGFVGHDMDPEARKRVFKRTRADIEKAGTSRALMTWPQFLEWAEAQVAAYNARPHSGLPKIRDPETGRRRHQSPAEAWAAHEADGWVPKVPEQEELDDMFRPQVVRTTRRGMVRFADGLYFAPELVELHGESVLVGFDVRDPSRVWVRDRQHRLVAIAGLDANKRPYFPAPMIEKARERRLAAQIARLERKTERLVPVVAPIDGAAAAVLLIGDRRAPAPSLSRPTAESVQERCRRKSRPGEAHQKIWTALRSRVEPWSTPDLTAAAGCVKRSVTLYLQALAGAGYVELVAPAGPGGMGAAVYRLAQDTGPRAPQRLRDGRVYDRNKCEIIGPKAGDDAPPAPAERTALRVVGGR